MLALLAQRRLRWLGHTRRMGGRMSADRLPKNILYGELASVSRPIGRPMLRYKDVSKRDLKACGIELRSWECIAADRNLWRAATSAGVRQMDVFRMEHRTGQLSQIGTGHAQQTHTCTICGKVCLSRIGLYSHSRRCNLRRDGFQCNVPSMVLRD